EENCRASYIRECKGWLRLIHAHISGGWAVAELSDPGYSKNEGWETKADSARAEGAGWETGPVGNLDDRVVEGSSGERRQRRSRSLSARLYAQRCGDSIAAAGSDFIQATAGEVRERQTIEHVSAA